MTRYALLAILVLSACGKHGSGRFHLKLGDVTVYELVDRRWNHHEPKRDLVLHADGTAELINDKTDKPWMTFQIKEDGTVLADGKPVATISEHGITGPNGKAYPLEIDGDTITVHIEQEAVKVVLAKDGNITVVARPDGNKWRIDTKDEELMRTAFLVLAMEMKVALD